MPTAPAKPCRHPGCPALIRAGSGAYCDQHKRSSGKAVYDQTRRRDDPALALNARIRSTAAYQRHRAVFRARNPLCCDPLGYHRGFPEPMAHMHHVIPMAERPDLALDSDNCRALCVRCHAEIERRERAGERTAGLFGREAA